MATPDASKQGDLQALISIATPLFRRSGTTQDDFSAAWHRHAQVVSPWFLHVGVERYTQIHLHQGKPTNESQSSTYASQRGNAAESATASQLHPNGQRLEDAKTILQQASGIAYVQLRPILSSSGEMVVFGDGLGHPYFMNVIASDERRFLHEESGASGKKPEDEQAVYNIPTLDADEWLELAFELRGVESVKIDGGKAIINGLWWEEWEVYQAADRK